MENSPFKVSVKNQCFEGKKGHFCETCSVYVPNDTSLQAHLKGQKHTKNIERIVAWTECAKRSVYVGGLETMPTAELALADYFSQFGAIKKITTDKTKKHYAIVELESEQAAHKVLEIKSHEIFGTLVTVKPREVKICRPTCFNKHKTKVRPVSEELWEELCNVSTTGAQMLLLQKRFELTEEENHLRDLICQLLESALHEVFPNCSMKPYGSSVSGFGTHGCDLDLHFQYSEVHPDLLQELLLAKDRLEDEEQHSVGDRDVTKTDILMAIGEIIKQCVPDCHRIKVIATARTPVVRFYHKGSSLKCDISLSNQLAVNNTAYLRYCIELCPLMKPLVFLVRTWMKHWELAGGVHVNGPRLNNYAVTLLVLFYLQNTKKLPSLVNMRSTSSSNASARVIEGWDCSFPQSSHENSSVSENSYDKLLEWTSEFFTFYSKIDFSKVLLDLRSATFHDVPPSCSPSDAEGASSCDLSNCRRRDDAEHIRERHIRYNSLNVQDPFELSHNVASNVNAKHLLNVVRCFHNAGLIIKMKRFRQKQIGAVDWGIWNLFVDHHQKKSATLSGVDGESATAKISHSMEMSFVVKLDSVFKSTNSSVAMGLIVVVLRDVFGIGCDPVSTENDDSGTSSPSRLASTCAQATALMTCRKKELSDNVEAKVGQKRPASPNDYPYMKRAKVLLTSPIASKLTEGELANVAMPCEFQCSAAKRLWQGRRKARRKLVQHGMSDLLQLEKQISRLLLTDLNKSETESGDISLDSTLSSDCESGQPIFRFALRGESEKDSRLKLHFRCLTEEGKSDFINFFHHVESFLPTFVVKCMSKSNPV